MRKDEQLNLKISQLNSKQAEVDSQGCRIRGLTQEVRNMKLEKDRVSTQEDCNLCLSASGAKLYKKGVPRQHYDSNDGLIYRHLDSLEGIVYKYKTSEFFNKVEFTLLYNKSDPYKLESSIDGITWSQIVDFSNMDCKGKQIVYFEKRKLQYLCIRLNRSVGYYENHNWIKVGEGDVIAMLDTTTGERKNVGQQ